jgi:hypothetical protein
MYQQFEILRSRHFFGSKLNFHVDKLLKNQHNLNKLDEIKPKTEEHLLLLTELRRYTVVVK